MCFSLVYSIFLVISSINTMLKRYISIFAWIFFINSYSVTVNKSYEMATVRQNYNFAFIPLTNDVIIRCLFAKNNFR